MNPAFSVIVFTTLSGAGYGLLAWAALLSLRAGAAPRTLLWATALGLLLSTVGLLSSLLHLGKPARAWRAFSQWRTSWLSRAGVLAVAVVPVALAFALRLLPGMLAPDAAGAAVAAGAAGTAVAALLALLALATVACTAMIYASLKPVPAWRHRLVPAVYLLFALVTGGWLLAALHRQPPSAATLAALAAGPALLALLKWRYWRDIDRAGLPLARGDAIGLPARTAAVFERPHTEANYITREMAFAVARRHARALRAAALVLFALAPLALVALAAARPGALAWALPLGAACALAGAVVERWLFFAEARHVVTLYY
ncbi:MAG TPA: DmsC/YnfH family molybdoenzyme membrane anchor subunit [Thermomonas sp.]|nr:DmsC/YnfH family molybdoenzyme membrane anchor subunit [Thermomonas sp.]